jgi:response regulator NasT
MAAFGLTEPEAFKWIQRAAMDNRMTMKDVANKIIAENLPDAGSQSAPK